MTDREIDKAYKELMTLQAPDLWERIDSQLEAKEVRDMKESLWTRIRRTLFGGGTVRTAVSVCVICIICIGAVHQIGGSWFRMGASGGSSKNSSAVTAEMAAAGEGSSSDYGMMYSSQNGSGVREYATAETGAASENKGENMDAAAAEAADIVTDETAAETDADASETTQRKLIRNIYIDAETMDFDNLVNDLQRQTDELGGYVEYSSISGRSYYYDNTRYAELSLRIPKDKTDEFLNQVGEAANITSKSENVQDVTLTYVDLESHVKALRTEEEQLMNILAQAETVEDIMSIQSRLSEVRYQLESYASQLNTYDNQVEYDTVTIYISEVTKETPTEDLSVWDKMKEGFADSVLGIGEGFTDLCIWFVANIPYFVILFVVVLAIIAIVKRKRGKK